MPGIPLIPFRFKKKKNEVTESQEKDMSNASDFLVTLNQSSQGTKYEIETLKRRDDLPQNKKITNEQANKIKAQVITPKNFK